MIEIKPVTSKRERNIFLTFPWRIYKNDPLWVPPILSEKAKVIDPARGLFFRDGCAELFIAWKDGKGRHGATATPAGFFPGVPNFNEVLIHLNGLRHPWDYLRYLRYRNTKPKCIAIKSVVLPPEYWDTGVAILLFDEMAKRASARGYEWADLSLTGESNVDTWPLAHHMGAQMYKRYRFYKKSL